MFESEIIFKVNFDLERRIILKSEDRYCVSIHNHESIKQTKVVTS